MIVTLILYIYTKYSWYSNTTSYCTSNIPQFKIICISMYLRYRKLVIVFIRIPLTGYSNCCCHIII